MSSSEPTAAGPAGSEASAQIELSARLSSIELSVVASDFRPLASGIGTLSAAVAPGIYQVVARAGPIIERKLIKVGAGDVYRDDNVDVRFPASAPVTDTTTSHEYQQAATEQASAAVANQSGPPSGLVIVVRDTRGFEGPPLEPGDIAAFDLLDESMVPVAGFAEGWQIQANEAVATWGRRLPPGGYALRTDPARAPAGSRAPVTSQRVDQSIWLSENWQTVVFITTGPGGPRTAAASVHMGHVGMGWSAYEKEVGQALELANWGLREGRSVVPDNLMNVLLNTKFVNPMLGIVGAHSLLLHEQPDAKLLDIVLRNLEGMVPGHPDVAALRWMASVERQILPVGGNGEGGGAGGNGGTSALGGASWPPMLLPSYRALIAMDAVNSGAIADRSPAERAAANLLVQGIWTTWKPIEPLALMEEAPHPPPPPPGTPLPSSGAGAPPARPSASVLAALGDDPGLLERIQTTDPATARVAGYLSALAALEGSARRSERFATLTPAEISLATTLPVASVDRALDGIATVIPPGSGGTGSGQGGESGGGGGGGGGGNGGGAGLSLKGLLSVAAAAALLVGGVVGAIAVCSGSDLCALNVNVVDTPVPTLQPTFLPSLSVSLDPETDATPSPEPTPIVLQHPPQVDFGRVTIFAPPGQQPLTVLAEHQLPLTFAIVENPDQAFAVPSEPCIWVATDTTLLACTSIVDFAPLREGPHVATLGMQVADEPEPRLLPLLGEGLPLFLRHAGAIEYPSAFAGRSVDQSFEVFAEEAVDISFRVTDDDASAFGAAPTCQWVQREFGDFLCSVLVTFSPPSAGAYKATLEIVTFEPEPRRVQITGTAIDQIL